MQAQICRDPFVHHLMSNNIKTRRHVFFENGEMKIQISFNHVPLFRSTLTAINENMVCPKNFQNVKNFDEQDLESSDELDLENF